MSSKFILASITTISLGAIFGFSMMKMLQSSPTTENYTLRTIASSPIMKLGAEQVSKNYFDVRITNESVAAYDKEISIVKATITTLRDIPEGLQYRWQLHQDMISTDSLTGTLPEMKVGTTQEFTLTVTGFSKEHNSHINFVILGQLAGQNIRRSVITSSRPEDSLGYLVEQNALKEAQEEASGTKKINKLNNGKKPKTLKEKFNLNNVVR